MKRYSIFGTADDVHAHPQDFGEWVRYEDAAERIAELGEENERLREENALLLASADADAMKLSIANMHIERLLTLATKWCDKDHHDWQEILKMSGNHE